MERLFLQKLKTVLIKELNFELEAFEQINKGMSNKLFTLKNKKGDKLLLKIYYSQDGFERETKALSFLNKHGFSNVPKPYYISREDKLAVYSFEEGVSKTSLELNREDIIKMASFVASINNIKKQDIDEKFSEASGASFSYQGFIDYAETRLAKFEKGLSDKGLSPLIKEFAKSEPTEMVRKKIEALKNSLGKEVITRCIDDDYIRLSSADFGPHNIIFQDNGNLIFIDFEYFGYDDPLMVIAEFAVHDQTMKVPDKLKKLFVAEYLKKTEWSEEFVGRLPILIKIINLCWMAIFLNSITKKGLKQMVFADKNFNQDEFILRQIAKFKERLDGKHNLELF